jgi:hypothetical protein
LPRQKTIPQKEIAQILIGASRERTLGTALFSTNTGFHFFIPIVKIPHGYN